MVRRPAVTYAEANASPARPLGLVRESDAPDALVPAAFRQRVFRYRKPIGGCRAWYALSPAGELLAPGLCVVWPDDDEAKIVAKLVAAARAADRPNLQLVRERPTASGLSPAAFVRLLNGARPLARAPLPRA